MTKDTLDTFIKAIRIGACYDLIKIIVPSLSISLITFLLFGNVLTSLEILGAGALGIQLHKVSTYLIRIIWAKQTVKSIFGEIIIENEESK